MRGSAEAEEEAAAGAEVGAGVEPDAVTRAGPGTVAGAPGVGSADDADDSCCFDLSGDSPATDASSMRHTPSVRQPNRQTLNHRPDTAVRTMYQCPV
jgi:hypothetical protein